MGPLNSRIWGTLPRSSAWTFALFYLSSGNSSIYCILWMVHRKRGVRGWYFHGLITNPNWFSLKSKQILLKFCPIQWLSGCVSKGHWWRESGKSTSNNDGCVPCHKEIMSQWIEWTWVQFLLQQVFICLWELILFASWWINTPMLSEYEFLKTQESV